MEEAVIKERRSYLILSVAIMLAFGASLFSAGVGHAQIKIGVIEPLTGPVALDGLATLDGIKLAAESINAQGGLLGQKIELMVEDGKAQPTESTTAAEKLIVQDKVAAIIGAWASSASLAVMPRVDKYGVPLMVETSTSPKITSPGVINKWTFRISPHTEIQAKYSVPPLVKNGFKDVAIIALNNDWGRMITKYFGDEMEKGGQKVLMREHYVSGETNFTPLISKAKTLGAKSFIFNGDTQAMALFVKQTAELGLKVPRALATAGDLPEIIKLAGKDAAEGVIQVDYYDWRYDSPANKKFVELWTKKFSDKRPWQANSSGYIGMMLIAEAIKLAASADRAQIRDALEKVKYEAPTGLHEFDQNHQAYPKLFLRKVVNGEGVLMKTD